MLTSIGLSLPWNHVDGEHHHFHNTSVVYSLIADCDYSGNSETPDLVSPNTPPVPGKTAQRIWWGEFVDLANLLLKARADTSLEQGKSSKEKKKHKPQINSIVS